jgi:Inward rectifier potassium channel C-terminal domain
MHKFLVSISGTDATSAAPVHAVYAYEPADLLWGFRFADMMTVDGGGRTRIELVRLHEVLPVQAGRPQDYGRQPLAAILS